MKKEYVAILGGDKLFPLQFIVQSWLRNLRLFVIVPEDTFATAKVLQKIFFLRRYIRQSIRTYKAGLGDYKGLWYQVNTEAIELTAAFYDQEIKNNDRLIRYYNKVLKTEKFAAYIKQQISVHIFTILKDLHLIRLHGLNDKPILMEKNPIHMFVVRRIEEKYGLKYNIHYVFSLTGLLALGAYYAQLFLEFSRRGIVFNKPRETYSLSKEATWGFHQKTLRDDMVIDGKNFTQKDLLLFEINRREPQRLKAFKKAKQRGFDTVSIPDLKINIRRNIFDLLWFYLVLPMKWYFQLSFSNQAYLFCALHSFFRKCFPFEVLMNLYDIKCNISVYDHGDIETTIVLNKYGTKNVIFHWSDETPLKDHLWVLVAHNIYVVWGNIHHDFNALYRCVDQKVNIGCLFKKAYFEAINNKERIISRLRNFNRKAKTVVFFDTSFADSIFLTRDIFLEYVTLIRDFCRENGNINVLLKPKSDRDSVRKMLGDKDAQYEKMLEELAQCGNFICLDPSEWSIEEAIAVSDVNINLGMTSPATIALICGKDALYYERTGNREHPFANKYMGQVVFDDRRILFQQIDNILKGKFHCLDVITQEDIREYDAYGDSNAIERLAAYLKEVVSEATLPPYRDLGVKENFISGTCATQMSESSV